MLEAAAWAKGYFPGKPGWGRGASTCVCTCLGCRPEQTGPPKGDSGLSEPQLCDPNIVTHILHTLLLTCTHSDTCTCLQHAWMFSHGLNAYHPPVHRCTQACAQAPRPAAQTLTPRLSSKSNLGQRFSGHSWGVGVVAALAGTRYSVLGRWGRALLPTCLAARW